MGETAKNLPCTLEDWIELEKSASVRHEFKDGFEVACLNETVTLEQIYDDVVLEAEAEE